MLKLLEKNVDENCFLILFEYRILCYKCESLIVLRNENWSYGCSYILLEGV